MHSKIIHYCWFGGELPSHQKQYIEEWKKIFPDYEIKHWHEGNIPRGDEYVERVLTAKKWAFLADHIRLYALYHYGGIYFDTDVKVVKNFEHELNNDIDCLFGFESEINSAYHYIGTAVIAAQKGSPLIKQFLAKYDKRLGKMMARNDIITGPKIITSIFEEKGLKSAETQTIEKTKILQKDYFFPSTEEELNKCYAIHDGAYSWHTKSKSLSDRLYKKRRKLVDKIVTSLKING